MNARACTGCGAMLERLLIPAMRTLVEENRATPAIRRGRHTAPVHRGGTVEKCTMCAHRLEARVGARLRGETCRRALLRRLRH